MAKPYRKFRSAHKFGKKRKKVRCKQAERLAGVATDACEALQPTINPRQMKRRLSTRPSAERRPSARPPAVRLILVKAAGSSERGLTRRL